MLNHIVIVDDSKAIREALKKFLVELGIEKIDDFSSALTALDYIKETASNIDAVLTDLQMPAMDGLEFVEELGKINYRGGVVIISGMDERIVKLAVDIALSHQIQLVGSVEKPIIQDKLAQQLQRVSQLQRQSPTEVDYLKRRELVKKLEGNELIPYYQPKVNLNSGELIGLEVLCRLDDPIHNKIITPDRFIPVAEKFNLIDLLTEKVIEHALPEFNLFRESFPEVSPSLAINIAPNQLYNNELPNMICSMCERFQVGYENIMIEVTERQLITDNRQLANINRLRIKGFGVSLDDFGAGFTNIRQIRNYPFTEIKLDQGLVKHIATDRVSQVIMEALYGITSEINMSVVAEGIEKIDDYEYMEKQKGIIAQGYLISRPKPIKEIIRWYHAWLKKMPGEA